ncbi:MAG: hypothetical protein NTW65_12925 [Deltaproteobacteria bacterium]|nr:hypothetical protein [Deltaproteobacteria bacterium]
MTIKKDSMKKIIIWVLSGIGFLCLLAVLKSEVDIEYWEYIREVLYTVIIFVLTIWLIKFLFANRNKAEENIHVDEEILNNTKKVNREIKIEKSNNISKEKNWINKNITISGLFTSYIAVLFMVLWLIFCFFITKFLTDYISEDMRNIFVLIMFLPGSFGIYKVTKKYFNRK